MNCHKLNTRINNNSQGKRQMLLSNYQDPRTPFFLSMYAITFVPSLGGSATRVPGTSLPFPAEWSHGRCQAHNCRTLWDNRQDECIFWEDDHMKFYCFLSTHDCMSNSKVLIADVIYLNTVNSLATAILPSSAAIELAALLPQHLFSASLEESEQ